MCGIKIFFELSSSTLDSLLTALNQSDFGIFVLSADDIAKIRKKQFAAARDNVVLELGLSIGRLGKHRTFFVVPRDVQDFHLPTDLVGMTPATFATRGIDGNLSAALGAACNKIRRAINRAVIREPIGTALDVQPDRRSNYKRGE